MESTKDEIANDFSRSSDALMPALAAILHADSDLPNDWAFAIANEIVRQKKAADDLATMRMTMMTTRLLMMIILLCLLHGALYGAAYVLKSQPCL